jgi:hypothetical protein
MKIHAILRIAVTFTCLVGVAGAAQAQLFRAYVAPDGNDSNTCTLPAPCRLLPAALAAVASGGEIWMLDSGNYNTGPVNVAKSVTILAVPGALGSVVALGGNAFDIATPGVRVVLRNLTIVPFPGGGGTNGINLTAATSLTVENCVVANMPGGGIVVNASATLRVTDTIVRDNGGHGVLLQDGAHGVLTRATLGGNGGHGVFVLGAGAGTTTTADVADTTLDGNATGLYAWSQNASAALKVSVRDSRAVRSSGYGLLAQSDAGGAVTLSAASNIVSNNGSGGIGALSSGSKLLSTGNTVSDNGFGLFNSGALFEAAGGDAVRHNTSGDTSGTITPIAPL